MNATSVDLVAKCRAIRRRTFEIHRLAPETRLASSLSCVEVLVALYYGGLLRFRPSEPLWEQRDRLVVSKGHGSISLFPILAELGYFPESELQRVCKEGTFLGGIPDGVVPGYETTNGSLGHGPGVAVGMAIALRARQNDSDVYVMVGDGELYEGSVWEALMLGAARRLDHLTLIVDANQTAMLDFCRRIMDLEPLAARFEAFGWRVLEVDGHDVQKVRTSLDLLSREHEGRPKVLVARTVKGKGVPSLEGEPLSHIKAVPPEELDALIREYAR
jgi:transketolase